MNFKRWRPPRGCKLTNPGVFYGGNSPISTKDELDGSIAKTQGELVALEKKGERSYYEFDLTKSRKFKNVGSSFRGS